MLHSSTLAAVHHDEDSVSVVELFGEADISTRRTLEGALSRGLSMGAGAMVLDVSSLTFCDATCVGAVLEANTAGGVVLSGAMGTVARVFEILDPDQSIARYRAPAHTSRSEPPQMRPPGAHAPHLRPVKRGSIGGGPLWLVTLRGALVGVASQGF